MNSKLCNSQSKVAGVRVIVLEADIAMVFEVVKENGKKNAQKDESELKMEQMLTVDMFSKDNEHDAYKSKSVHVAVKVESEEGKASFSPIISEDYDDLFADTTRLKNLISIAGILAEKNCLDEIFNIVKILPMGD